MQVSNNYIAVERVFEPEKEIGDFKTVEVFDDFLFRGRVKYLPEAPVYLGNENLKSGDIILFAKYSPDTHDIEY